jgi:exopolyphosphatase/pppGpp-phosphohydrolase
VTAAPPSLPAVEIPPGATIAASIDVGANSVHLLVAAVEGHRIEPLVDESVFLGLGDRVAAEPFIGSALREALVADLDRYVATARSLGAASITIVGTEPVRRAEDAPALVRSVEARTGAPFHVLHHEEEGLLTLLAATAGRPIEGELLVVDIGGGSSQFVLASAGRGVQATGLQLGSARLTRSIVRFDPPRLAEIAALRDEVARIMVDAPDGSPDEIIAVGGTASNLLRLLPATAIDRALTRRRIAVALAMLTVERSSEAAARHGLRPERARILPAGAIIVDAILDRYRAERLLVSEAGIREGAILAAVHGGAAWRDRLRSMVSGWDEPAGQE